MPFDEEELDPHGECRATIHRLCEAMRVAKKLIGACNDTASEAVKASNINQAWHVLNDNLPGAR